MVLGDNIKCLHKLIKYKSYAGSLLKFSFTNVNFFVSKSHLIPEKLLDQTKYLGFLRFLSKKSIPLFIKSMLCFKNSEFNLLKKSKDYQDPREEDTESKYPEIVKNIALIYNTLGQKDKALDAIKSAREANPDDVGLIITTANIYFELGDKEAFKSSMSEAIENLNGTNDMRGHNSRNRID